MIPGQMMITPNGFKTKVDLAIDRLRSFEPEEGYYVAFSGGKDSQCIYHLCEMAGADCRDKNEGDMAWPRNHT